MIKTIVQHFSENFGWKLLSLAAAFVIWMAVASEPEIESGVDVPVQFRNTPRDLEISSNIPTTVKVELAGISGRLRGFVAAPTPIVLNFSDVKEPGERTFDIGSDQIHLPTGVELVRAVPALLRFRFERREQRIVPIQVRISSMPRSGNRVLRLEPIPSSLAVVGPQSQVKLVDAIHTDPVDLADVKNGDIVMTSPYLEQAQVRFSQFQPVHVRVILKN